MRGVFLSGEEGVGDARKKLVMIKSPFQFLT